MIQIEHSCCSLHGIHFVLFLIVQFHFLIILASPQSKHFPTNSVPKLPHVLIFFLQTEELTRRSEALQ